MSGVRVINEEGHVVPIGSMIVSFRGESWYLQGTEEPRSHSSSGRVYVSKGRNDPSYAWDSFYPGVFSLRIERDSA